MPELPSEETIQEIKNLRKVGRYLDAWNICKAFSPPEDWADGSARLTGASILERVGAIKRAERMVLKEWRHAQDRSLVREAMFWEVLSRRGAFLTWKWLNDNEPGCDENEKKRADHLARRAIVLMDMRDFERAEECLNSARALNPSSPWYPLLMADNVWKQDRPEEALEQVNDLLRSEADYVSAIRVKADLLNILGRSEEAVEVLKAGLGLVQASQLAVLLINILLELKRLDESWETIALYESLLPLAETAQLDWAFARRCDISSFRNDAAQALHWAEKIEGKGFYSLVAEKLRGAKDEELKRHQLPVPFVRQHHSTCAPASVTSIALYWGKEVGHLELADEICYDGTSDYKERSWAEKNGWATREFRVTWDSAKQLLDEGMPFVLNTVYPGNAHAQVVAGYDEYRRVFFVRDPGNPHTLEYLAAEALAEQAPYGPRGFVMVPQLQEAKLRQVSLPDTEMYDLGHQLEAALDRHDRERAMSFLEVLRRQHGDHLLRWHSELDMARYDSRSPQALAAIEEMLKQHPKVENWQTQRLSFIREVHGRDAMLAALREVCSQKDCHAIHLRMLARELHWDDRSADEAARLLKRVHRKRLDAYAILSSANLIWNKQRYAEAAEFYRLAACLESRNEDLVTSYFNAAVYIRQGDVALAMMRRRFEQEGIRSGQPAMTLYQALNRSQREEEGLEVLEAALRKRPTDTSLALFVAEKFLLWNKEGRAKEILGGITSRARSAEWHRVQARIAEREGNVDGQMHHLREILHDQPLDSTAHRSIARLLDMQEGRLAGYEFLKEACSKHAFQWHLHMALLDWASQVDLPTRESAVKELIRIDPRDAWARRELAEIRCLQCHYDEAHQDLDLADALDGSSTARYTMRASVLEAEGRLAEAREQCEKALRLDVDCGYAMRGLLRLSRSHEQRESALTLILGELKRQTTQGDAVSEFAGLARGVLDDAALEQVLRESLQERPDLWQTGTFLAEHLQETGRETEAVAIFRDLVSRFPLIPRLWLGLAFALERSGDRLAAIEAANKVREINPTWSWGMRSLSELKRKSGDYAGARAVMLEVLRHCPDDALCHGFLAEILWHGGDRTEALNHAARAVERDPDYGWGWDKLDEWGQAAGQPEAVKEAALRLQKERPGEARTWIIYAERLTAPHELERAIEALDKAIEISPLYSRPADLKAWRLAKAGRFEEALKVCREHPSKALTLKHREGWVLHKSGKYKEAVRVLDAALEEDPSYIWPWRLLAEWHQENDALELAEKASRQLVRLQPGDGVPLGYLGTVLEDRKQTSQAKEVYRQALDVTPDYPFALHRLFSLYVSAAEWENAAALLERAAVHFPLLAIQSRWIVYHAHRRHWEEARQTLSVMLQSVDDDANAFTRVAEALKLASAQQARQLRKLVETVLTKGDCNPSTGHLYVELCRQTDILPAKKVLDAIPLETVLAERAFNTYLYWLGDRWKNSCTEPARFWGFAEKRRWTTLKKKHQSWIRSVPDLYGAVTYMLNEAGASHESICWLSDWRLRKEQLEPYVLNNYVLALQKAGHVPEMRDVLAFGMTLPDNDAIKMRFHLWAAMESLLEGDMDAATSQMDAVNPQELNSFGKKLLSIVETILAYYRDDPPDFRTVRDDLASFMATYRSNKYMNSVIRRLCVLAGRRLGSWRPKTWYWEKRIFGR